MNNEEVSLGPLLANSFGDRYFYKVNRNTFNTIGSEALYRSLLKETVFNEYQLNVVIGTDSGLFPRFIAKQGVPVGARFIFLELPVVLDALRQDAVLEDLPPEITVTTINHLMEQAEQYKLSEYVFLDAVRIQESVASGEANLPEYRELSWSANQQVMAARQEIWGSTYPAAFILRQLENLTEGRVPFSTTLCGAFPGRTAVILAGGPSLRLALPWVKKNRERLVVIAVSRISRILQEEGLTPHMVVSVDPQRISFEVSRELLLFADTPEMPVFAYGHHASPLLIGQWPGKSVYYGALLPWRSPLNVDHLSYNGPTVSNSSISLALHMGCTTIMLAGVDLCYGAGGQTHAAGSNEEKVGPDLSQLTPKVETYGGRMAETNPGYAGSLHMLGLQAELAAEKGCQMYNCALDAARVPGIEYRSLEELELPDFPESASEIINRQVTEPSAAAWSTHYRRIKKEVERARAKFQEILNLSHEALDCTDGLFGRNGKTADFRHKIRMDKIERRLDRSLSDFSAMVKRFGLKKFLTILRTPKRAEEWTDQQIEDATREYYEAYVEGTETVMGLIDSTLERIEARMEEVKEAPDLGRLFAQWEKDEQYGRLREWRRKNPERAARMTASEKEAADRLDAEFTRVMTEESSTHMNLLQELHDVRHTRGKALLLFQRKSVTELEEMEAGLTRHPDQEKSRPYLDFIRGLLAELRNDAVAAATCYEGLITDPPHPLTEDALLQIANLSIAANDAGNALLALECLSGISPAYLPPYGELLKLLGRFDEAFHAYNRYLGLVPEDVGAMIRLGMLCKEARLDAAATELFERALEKDPTNGAAQILLEEVRSAGHDVSA